MLYQFSLISLFFFFNDTATTEIYTLSLHDALPISVWGHPRWRRSRGPRSSDRLPREARDGGRRRRDLPHLQPGHRGPGRHARDRAAHRSEEHTSELQSLAYLVCRLLLEKKKKKK